MTAIRYAIYLAMLGLLVPATPFAAATHCGPFSTDACVFNCGIGGEIPCLLDRNVLVIGDPGQTIALPPIPDPHVDEVAVPPCPLTLCQDIPDTPELAIEEFDPICVLPVGPVQVVCVENEERDVIQGPISVPGLCAILSTVADLCVKNVLVEEQDVVTPNPDPVDTPAFSVTLQTNGVFLGSPLQNEHLERTEPIEITAPPVPDIAICQSCPIPGGFLRAGAIIVVQVEGFTPFGTGFDLSV